MQNLLYFLLLGILMQPLHAWGELQTYIDRNGVVHIVDNVNNAPEIEKKNVYSRQEAAASSQNDKGKNAIEMTYPEKKQDTTSHANEECLANIKDALADCKYLLRNYKIPLKNDESKSTKEQRMVSAYYLCGHPLVHEEMTAQDKNELDKITSQIENARRSLTKKQLYVAESWPHMFFSRCEETKEKIYSSNDLAELDAILKNIWREMNEALVENDVRAATEYYCELIQDDWSARFNAYPLATRLKIAQNNLSAVVRLVKVEGNQAICEILTTRDGQQYSFQLIFMQNFREEWKIFSY